MSEIQAKASTEPSCWRHDRRKTADRGYGYRWQKARKAFLASHPLCEMCEKEGKVTAANVVDHRIPHRGDEALFWDQTNWAPLCKPHHDGDKQAIEKTGRAKVRIGLDGYPVE